jgi:hypothetical protein
MSSREDALEEVATTFGWPKRLSPQPLPNHELIIRIAHFPPFTRHNQRMGSTADPTRDDTEDTCVICLSSVTERAITVPCNHYTFDFVCLVSWLQERSTCPLCRYYEPSLMVNLT